MPRNRNVTRAHQRSRVATAQGGSFGLSVVAPNGGNVGDPTALAASQLMDALGVGQKLAAAEGERRQNAGIEDALTGDIDEELRARSENYRNGVVKVQAEAGFIHAASEMQQKLDQLDLSSVEPDQLPSFLNRAIDEAAAEQYAGLDDKAQAEIVVPLLRKFRGEYIAKVVGEQKALAEGEQQANLRTIAGAMAATPSFDYNGLNERVTSVFGKSRKAQELSFGMIADIAIREGRPELLEQMPDKWGSGAPTAKILPEFAAAYRSAVNQAQANAAARETERARAQTAANKEAVRMAELQAAHSILFENRDPAQSIAQLMALPGAEASSVFAIQGAWRSARDDREERDGDADVMANLWSDIYTGRADVSTVLQAYGLGVLGSGLKAKEEAQRMYAAVNQIGNGKDSDRNRIISEHQQNLSERYNPNINGPLGRMDANRNMIRIQAQREYNQRVLEAGEDPVTVLNEVSTKYDTLLEQVGFNPLPGGSVSTQAKAAGLYAAPAIRAFAAGQANANDLINYGVKASVIQELFNANQISSEEANAAMAAIPH